MPQRWSHYLAIWSFAVMANIGSCFADPVVDEKVMLQICHAYSEQAAEKMPPIVSESAKHDLSFFFDRFSYLFDGCLSATEMKREPSYVTFLVQHKRVESLWRLVLGSDRVDELFIDRYRAVTLANDEKWRRLVAPVSSDMGDDLMTERSDPVVAGRLGQSDPNIVEFFYATNREELMKPDSFEASDPVQSANGWTAVTDYTGERNAELSFGAIKVRVPEGHRIGKLELPSSVKIFGFTLKAEKPDAAKHFTIRGIGKTDEEEWIKSLSSATGKKALIFVHGFNTKFRDAAFRTAQIVWDLQYHGTAVLFSWPSRGEIADYFYDKDSALGSRAALLRVIADVRKAGYDDIDVIAHSMGNLIAVDALSNSAVSQSPAAISQLIMAAPDVDRDMFVQAVPGLAKVTKGLTLYASAADKALALSKRVAGSIPRAGDVPASGPLVVAAVATIDVSAIGDELFGLNHSVFATTRNILNDLKLLLETGAPPPRLAEIRGYPEPPQKASYFRYVP